MQTRHRELRRRPSRLPAVIVPAVISFALLASAGWGYRSQAARDNGLADHGVTTTAVISRVFHGPLMVSESGGSSYTLYAIVAFTADGGPASARVTLENCSGVCGKAYRDGGHLTVTYDSRDSANAVAGRPATPAVHLNTAILIAASLGLVFLVAAIVNLLVGV